MPTHQHQLQHLYLRAGFGIAPQDLVAGLKMPLQEHVERLFAESEVISPLSLLKDNELKLIKILLAGQEGRSEMVAEALNRGRELNLLWLNRMATNTATLREKMTLFWHGHFATRTFNAFFAQLQNNLIREKALSKFGDLLLSVSKDAAMLQFLNNQQNRKGSPNENFARELMELFTLGRGNYTESDVKEAARAFTGWGFNQQGEFVFRRFFHDADEKIFMGKSGNWGGEDIIRMILEKRETAWFITQKIYRHFVNEKIDTEIISELAKHFYESEYDIAKLMKKMFTADWFYAPHNIGCRIKAPVEYITMFRRQFGMQFEPEHALLFLQKLLGQILFYPPNVAGWAEGQNWIDSSTLMIRTLMPFATWREIELPVEPKEEGDVNTAFLAQRGFRKLKATANWQPLLTLAGNGSERDMLEKLASYLLQTELSDANQRLILQNTPRHSREAAVQFISLALASLPEYQLC
ncbi:MAG: DUF1800 domain-containing protein [Cytophagales bacterium]|nr:DUF1800 domain-containing protein [Cytophagales bacterium]